MDDGAPTGPKTILRYFPERFRHHHADRIRHVRRPNTNKRTLAIRWRLGLTVCVWMCSHLLVCVRACARVCEYGNTALPIVGRVKGMEETRARCIDHLVRERRYLLVGQANAAVGNRAFCRSAALLASISLRPLVYLPIYLVCGDRHFRLITNTAQMSA